MKTFQLEGTPRTDLGKKAVKALRKNGLIPAVLNGGEVFNLPYTGKLNEGEKVVEIGNNQALIVTDFTVTTNDVRKLVYTPDIFAVELTIGKKKVMAVIKDIQFHPVEEKILHMDFLEVTEKKPVVMEVPVSLEGELVKKLTGDSGIRRASSASVSHALFLPAAFAASTLPRRIS